jgi:molecular chaperone DnaK
MNADAMNDDAMNDAVVAIDLGTTNSLIGRMHADGPRLFADPRGSVLLPSVVGVADGRVLVGRGARNQLLLQPQATVARSKRWMGTEKHHLLGERQVSSTEVAAFILSELLNRSEAHLGQRPQRAVVTVPAFFKDAQRQATRDAGEIAGLQVERLVNEPTAAAINYETGQESRVLIYDFGGGTFDVSVLERDQGFLEVHASHGDTELGGSDIDAALVDHVLQRLGPQRTSVEADPRALTRLTESVERAKIALSERTSVQLVEPFLTGDGSNVVNLDLELTREQLERVIEPFVERTLRCIDQALSYASFEPSALDRLVLVGGTSKIPYVQARVAEHLKLPALVEEDADLAVALGAVRLAGRIEGLSVDDVLVDVTPHTLAAGVLEEDALVASTVIERNTVLPCVKRETYYTLMANQPVVEIPVVQGEHKLARDNTALGVLLVEDLPPGPASSPVDVEFRLDLSGVLQVSAVHVPSGRGSRIRIADSPYRLSKQERRAARAKFKELQARRDELPEASSNAADDPEVALARALLERATTVLQSKAESAHPDALERVRQAHAALGAALTQGATPDDVIEPSDALLDALLDLT